MKKETELLDALIRLLKEECQRLKAEETVFNNLKVEKVEPMALENAPVTLLDHHQPPTADEFDFQGIFEDVLNLDMYQN